MTADDYRYVTIHPYDDSFYGSKDLNSINLNQTPNEMLWLQILEGNVNIISLKLTTPPSFTDFQDNIRRQALQQYGYTFPPTEKIDAMVTVHYDAIMLLASAIKILFNEGKNFTDGLQLSGLMKRCEYDGLQTGQVRVDETGDSQLSYEVLGLSTYSTKLTPIWVYEADTDKFRQLRPTTSKKIVENIPRCGFSGEAKICKEEKEASSLVLKVSLSATLSSTVLLVFVVWFSFRTVRRLTQKLDQNWWKVDLVELYFPATNSQSSEFSDQSSVDYKGSRALAQYRGIEVDLQDITTFRISMSATVSKEISMHRLVNHDHLQRFIGISFNKHSSFVWLVYEHCSKGDLTSFLVNGNFKLDWSIKNSFIRDIAQGMSYLQTTVFVSHGNLNSYNCRIDGRLTLKITEYGVSYLRSADDLAPLEHDDVKRNFDELLWRSPELLSIAMPPSGTQKGDVYSFGIILHQIIFECYPYEISPGETVIFDILLQVMKSSSPPMRPSVSRSACSVAIHDLVQQCWSENPRDRPSFEKVCETLKRTFGDLKGTLVDQLVKRMEDYSKNLEAKTLLLVDEKRKSDDLLSLILPKSVAAALIRGDMVEPESYENVSIYFSDVVGFTTLSAELTPLKVVVFLNAIYTIFDNILESYDVYKVETIGDAYMIVSGLPLRNGTRHVTQICLVALHLRDEVCNFHVPSVTKSPGDIKIRIGLNTGACVAGVVGLKMPRYCLFGDTVNTASRMESTGEPMKIHISESTKSCLDLVGGFTVQKRGELEVKGKGTMTTFWLTSKNFEDSVGG